MARQKQVNGIYFYCEVVPFIVRLRKRYQFYLFHDSHVQFICLCFSYKRSAALGQFVIHRGLIISVMQVNSLLKRKEKVKNFKCAWNAIFFFLKLCNNVVFHFALFSLSTRTPSTIISRLRTQFVSRNVRYFSRRQKSVICVQGRRAKHGGDEKETYSGKVLCGLGAQEINCFIL